MVEPDFHKYCFQRPTTAKVFTKSPGIDKTMIARQRKKNLEEEKLQENVRQLNRWDIYRDEKLRLVKEYLHVLRV